MKFEDFLKQEINNFKKDNLKNLKSFLDSSAGRTKIENFKKRNMDLDVENIYNDALNGNQYAIAILRKDPKKQNVTEKAFFNFTGLKKLPQGDNGIRFGGSKAADFKIGEYYGTQKYIEQGGGAQDNQIMDMIIFCKEANKAGKKAIACVDGEYGKREIRNKLTENDNCLILDTDELIEGIKNGRFN